MVQYLAQRRFDAITEELRNEPGTLWLMREHSNLRVMLPTSDPYEYFNTKDVLNGIENII